ncbi:hypothetical protein GPB2148_2201 [marine gamma proteobacterium HTCC2148]|nr:hypothetical protein GPB2148_2201 [marine gamma proteobacterium HTCC2148]
MFINDTDFHRISFPTLFDSITGSISVTAILKIFSPCEAPLNPEKPSRL